MTRSKFVLKDSERRTTEVAGENRELIRKLFHSRGLRSFGDRRRAQKELRLLQRAHASGLPVPLPHEVSRDLEMWSLSMDRISGAQSLREIFEGMHAARNNGGLGSAEIDRAELVKQMGSLVADLAAAGIEHSDLHPGNLLLDPAGKLWLVDFAQAKARSASHPAGGYRDLVTLCASIREHTHRSERELAIEAFFEVHGSTAKGVDELEKLIGRVELHAQLERRSRVLRNIGRWMRSSGVAMTINVNGRSTVAARYLTDTQKLRPLFLAGENRNDITDERLTIWAPDQKKTVQAWMSAALMYEHRIPAARPLRVLVRKKGCAEFEVPVGTQLLTEARHNFTPAHLATSYGELLGSLHERFLQPKTLSAEQLLISPTGTLLAMPGVQFEKSADLQRPLMIRPELLELSFLQPATEAAFNAAYQSALKSPLLVNNVFSKASEPPDLNA